MKEEEIIGLVRKKFTERTPGIKKGIGDDTAVISWGKDFYMLMTTDAVVQNIHFSLEEATWRQVGKKAMAVNLSDIASMGGTPLYALASVGLPESSAKKVSALVDGMEHMARRYNFSIIGGNVSRSPVLFVDIAMTGRVRKRELLTRDGAKNGDCIYVTGRLGGTRIKKHLNIKPRVFEARELLKKISINSMIDISDGLSTDLTRLARASNKGFVIELERIPVARDAARISSGREDALRHALSDGEDYELLFTVNEKHREKVPESILKTPITYIGRITEEKRYIGLYSDRRIEIEETGFAHF